MNWRFRFFAWLFLVVAVQFCLSGCKEPTVHPLDKRPIEALGPFGPVYKLDNHGRVMDLRFKNALIDKNALEEIRALDGLRSLNLDGAKVSDEDVARLTTLKDLRFLTLAEALITDQGLIHLRTLDELRSLSLMKCEAVTSEGIGHLKKALPGLKISY